MSPLPRLRRAAALAFALLASTAGHAALPPGFDEPAGGSPLALSAVDLPPPPALLPGSAVATVTAGDPPRVVAVVAGGRRPDGSLSAETWTLELGVNRGSEARRGALVRLWKRLVDGDTSVAEAADDAASSRAAWTRGEDLPEGRADAAVVARDGRVLLVGGETAAGPVADVLAVVPSRGGPATVVAGALPALPAPRALAGATLLDGRVHLVGGIGPGGGAPLRELPGAAGWEPVPLRAQGGGAVPATAFDVASPLVATRRDEFASRDVLLVFGGLRAADAGRPAAVTSGAWRFAPGDGSRSGWTRLEDLPPGLRPGTAIPVGPAHLLALEAPARAEPSRLLTWHVMTGRWVELGKADGLASGAVVPWEGGHVVLAAGAGTGGAIASGGRMLVPEKGFVWLDFLVVALYMGAMLGIGEYFRRVQKTTTEYFLGGRNIPWWAAGLSIWATGVSAISYMAIPAKTYMTDWSYICLGLFPPITTVIVAYVFIPLLRRLEVTTVMEYLELRYDRSVRLMATFLMIVGNVGGRMGVVLLLPAVALTAVTGWDVHLCILGMGLITTVYTVSGGMKAGVWTDVAQTIVMFGGAIVSLVLVVATVDGGLGGVIEVATEDHKLRMFDFSWDFMVASFWVFLLWSMVDLWGRLGQEGLQKAFSTPDIASARKSMITSAVVSLPGTFLFYAIGTALYAFYHQHPEKLDPALPNDSIFPLFIVQQLPAGVSGLIIAGIFAAAMSTLSGMNSVATVMVKDWYAITDPKASDERQLRAAKGATLFCGLVATVMAIVLSEMRLPSLWDAFTKIMSLVGGGFGCAMILGLCTRRTTTAGVWAGTAAGTLVLMAIEWKWLPQGWGIHFFAYGTVATAAACLVAYAVSLAFPGRPRDLAGLTLWTTRRDGPRP